MGYSMGNSMGYPMGGMHSETHAGVTDANEKSVSTPACAQACGRAGKVVRRLVGLTSLCEYTQDIEEVYIYIYSMCHNNNRGGGLLRGVDSVCQRICTGGFNLRACLAALFRGVDFILLRESWVLGPRY